MTDPQSLQRWLAQVPQLRRSGRMPQPLALFAAAWQCYSGLPKLEKHPMIRYYLVDREWIVSGGARRIYRFSARLCVLLLVACIAILVFRPELFSSGNPLVRPFLLVWAISLSVTYFGMEVFLFLFDKSHALKQVIWFLVMLVPILGVALYCFAVYSRSDYFKPSDSDLRATPQPVGKWEIDPSRQTPP